MQPTHSTKPSKQSTEAVEQQIIDSQRTIDYDTKEFTVELLVEKFKSNDFFIPLYQRKFIWSENRQSRFIESVLLGLPIPFMFMADTPDGRLEIVDGAQRINTLRAYFGDELKLQNLETLPLLNNTYFSGLPLSQQRKFKNRTLRMIVLSDRTTEDAKFSIFERINTGSDTLKHSELRKGAYSGPFYSLVDELAKDPTFIKLCPVGKTLVQRGEREELVLRYLAYSERYRDFRHDVKDFLNQYIKNKNAAYRENKVSAKADMDGKKVGFFKMLSFVSHFFPYGFGKTPKATTTPRVRFEAISVGVHLALEANPSLVPNDVDWLRSKEFKTHVTTHGSNSAPRLRSRIEYVKNSLLAKG